MNSNEKSQSDVFRRLIFKGFEKVDMINAAQRDHIYATAVKSLETAQQKNFNLSEETKISQRNLLNKTIEEIETSVVDQLNQKLEHASNISVKNPKDDSLISLDVELEEDRSSLAMHELEDFSKPQKRGVFKRRWVFASLIIVVLGIFSTVFFLSSPQKNLVSELQLPYTLKADEELHKLIKLRGAAKAEFIEGDDGGIRLEVDALNNDEGSRVDIILRGKLAKKINALTEPTLVTFHVQKLSGKDFTLKLFFRGAGKSIIKDINILDQNLNEYFLVTNTVVVKKKRSNVIIRLEMAPLAEKFIEKPIIIIKKLVFSKI